MQQSLNVEWMSKAIKKEKLSFSYSSELDNLIKNFTIVLCGTA